VDLIFWHYRMNMNTLKSEYSGIYQFFLEKFCCAPENLIRVLFYFKRTPAAQEIIYSMNLRFSL